MSNLLSAISRCLRRSQNTSGKSRTSNRKAGRTRLRLGVLEDRLVLSPTISVGNASLNEIGNVSPFIAAGSGGLSSPQDLVQGPDGNVYVASYGTNSVIRYTPSGQLLGTFVAAGSGGLSKPYGLAFGPDGNLYVDSTGTNAVYEYSGSTGALVSTFVTAGSAGLNDPTGMVFGPDGNLYVSSGGTHSILRYQGPGGPTPGSPLPAAGQTGATFVPTASGNLDSPDELVFGPNGNLFVSSNWWSSTGNSSLDNLTTNGAVLEFDGASGNFVATYVAFGEGGLAIPDGLAFDQEGRLYVADRGTWSIHRYDSQGNYLDDPVSTSASTTGPASSLAAPFGIVFNAQGDLLVSSRNNNLVSQYSSGVIVTLSAASASPVTVQYATSDGTAVAGTDYTGQAGTITFAPGQTSLLIPLVTLWNATPPGNDSFNVQLSNPTGATIANGNAIASIVPPTLSQLTISNTSAIEGDPMVHYRGVGAFGTLVNQFNPVTFGPDGNLYAAVGRGPVYDTIERFNGITGAYMGIFAKGPIDGVRTIVFRGGFMYVASEYTNQVLQYDATTGAYLGVFVADGSGGINGPYGMAFDSAGNLYVSGRNSNTVVKYDTNGNPVGTYIGAGSGGLSLPEGIAFDPSGTYLYVASSGSNQVLKYNASTGAFVGVAANPGASCGDVVFGADGLMYVDVGGNNRIERYTENGTYVDDYVPAGSGGMSNSAFMSFGPNGDLYVSTIGNDQIFQFGTENEALFTVSLSAPFAEPVTVSYATADGTAVAGTNYTSTSGTLTFPAGITTETIRVPLLDSGSQTTPLTFTVTLSNPQATTLAQSQGTGTIAPSDQPAKFYVVNDATSSLGGTNTAYKYQPFGAAQAPFGLSLNDLTPMGVAANAAGTTEWVVDANKNIYVYSPGGTLLGFWSAGGLSSSATLTGIATNGTDIWLVDSYSDKVYKFTGAASRLSGSQSAASSFSLAGGKNGDPNPQDIVTDGKSFWVVDGTKLKVFKYTLSGSQLGSWTIDPANTHPTGITVNPTNVSDIWIVDNGTDKVYQYIGAASRTSGNQNAGATFALNPYDTNPQGIADPPAPDMPPTASGVALPPSQPTNQTLSVPAAPVQTVLARPTSLASRDALFALLAQPFLQDGAAPSADPAGPPAGALGILSTAADSPELALVSLPPTSSGALAADLWDLGVANVEFPAASMMDAFFAHSADDLGRPV